MNVALMNVRITIEKAVVSVDGIGNRKNAWEEYFSCAATVGGEKGKESETAAQTVDHADITFTVRSCSLTERVVSEGFRIAFQGEKYDILSVDHMSHKHICLKFRCRKVRR